MERPYAITLDVGSSLANRSSSSGFFSRWLNGAKITPSLPQARYTSIASIRLRQIRAITSPLRSPSTSLR